MEPGAWHELFAALAARQAPVQPIDRITIPFEEIETAPQVVVTIDRDREVIEVEVIRV